MTGDLIWTSATELLEGYRTKKLSPVEVTQAVLARIEEKDADLNAFCLVDADGALKAATASEARWHKGAPMGRLDGVPALIKDLLLTKGWPTLRGSKTVDPKGPWNDDAPSVARLKEHGAVLIGKTTTPEFGWKGMTDSPLTGITRNPWDTSKTPGGSSGGSSAAVAAGMGPIALGTDGGGSIRIPAGFTGIFGHKPSFGRVPAWPLSPFGTVAHVGPMTRTVDDAALMLTVISGPDARDWYSMEYRGEDYTKDLAAGIEGKRIAFSLTLGYVDVDPEIAGLVTAAAGVLKDLGAEVVEADPGLGDPRAIFQPIWGGGAAYLLGNAPKAVKDMLDPGLAEMVELGRGVTIADMYESTMKRAEYGAAMRLFMEDYDFLVTPTLPIPAFEAGTPGPQSADDKWTAWTPFSYPFNLTQQPAASVPCGFTRAGLPAGLHIVGRMFDDMGVLQASYAYQQASGWLDRKPPE